MTVIEPAVSPEDPIRPNRLLVTILAVLGGLALAIGAAGITEYRDDALRDRQRIALSTDASGRNGPMNCFDNSRQTSLSR